MTQRLLVAGRPVRELPASTQYPVLVMGDKGPYRRYPDNRCEPVICPVHDEIVTTGPIACVEITTTVRRRWATTAAYPYRYPIQALVVASPSWKDL